MDKKESLEEMAANVKFGMMLRSVPGFREAVLSLMAGETHLDCEKMLSTLVLGREPITTKDVRYGACGRIAEIGGQKVEGYNIYGMPVAVGGKKIKYGLFGIPVGFE